MGTVIMQVQPWNEAPTIIGSDRRKREKGRRESDKPICELWENPWDTPILNATIAEIRRMVRILQAEAASKL